MFIYDSSSNSFPTWGIVIIVVVAFLLFIGLIFLIWYISTVNKIRKLGVKVDESESGIDVALTKRFDLLTKEVAVVKGYAKHELETLEKVISMRQPAKGSSMKEKAEFSDEMTKVFDSINVVRESYPELKANQNFLMLQNQVFDVEEQLQASRRLYNSNVTTFNQTIITFPNSIVANKIGATKRDFFEAEVSKREDVKIEF